MNVLRLPKTAAALEYKALRLPSAVFDSKVIVRFLAEDSALRLRVERGLGRIDEKAGSLLGDQGLVTRGRALRRRSEVLGKAVELEAVASARSAAASSAVDQAAAKAARDRDAAVRAQRAAAQEARRKEQADKRAAAKTAAAQVQAEKARAQAEASAAAQAVSAQLKAQEKRIDDTTKEQMAAPKQQLDDAAERKKAADAERAKADRLAELVDAEKASRHDS